MFDEIVEQAEAKRLLQAALAEGPAHAYLFHGPAGVGKRQTALAFAGALLGDRGRVERRAHPDLYVLEPLGDQIRIDEIRALRRDLHMRPFEADRRVYLDRLGAPAERRGGRRAAEGPRGAARLRRHRAGRRRARPAAGDDPLALPARPVHAAVRAGRARASSTPGRRACRPSARPRSRASPAARLDRAERLLDADAAARREELLGDRARRSTPTRPSRPPLAAEPRARARRRRGRGGEGAGRQGARVARPDRRARPSSAAAGPSSARSARACSRRSRSWPPGTAT